MPRAARSFADDLRARSDVELAALLLARPDLANPAPADISSLAARATTRSSVQRALERLNAPALHLVEALLAVGAADAPACLGATKKAISDGIHDLWARGLVWRATNGWELVRPISELIPYPAGLGPSAPASDIPKRLEALSPAASAVLDQLRWSGPRATFSSPKLRSVRQELVDAGLAVAENNDDALLTKEVTLALREGRLYREPWGEPQLDIQVASLPDVDAAAASEALELLWRLTECADLLEQFEPRVLRNGGLAVRDHKRLAAALECSLELAAFVLEISYAAGLFASDEEIDATWRPTELYDEWAEKTPAARWVEVAAAWCGMTRAPCLAGQNLEGTLINVLSRDGDWPLMRARRHDILDVLIALPEGATPSEHDVDTLLRARRPLRLSGGVPTHSTEVLREAAWLGITGRGALTSAGRALVTSSDDRSKSAEIFAQSLPETVPGVLLQGDLTAIAPGPLTDEALAFIRRGADVESRGGATVFRFSEDSIRRLLEYGYSADEALESLRQFSLTPLPQALEYLVHDVARRYGHLRVGSIGSYVRSDDEPALDALLAEPGLAPLHLRRIAPTVLVSAAPARTLLDLLRTHRHSPVAETSDGGIVVRTQQPKRSPTPRRRVPAIHVTAMDADMAQKLVSRLRTGEAEASAREDRTRIPSSEPSVILALLEEAAANRLPVWLGYVDAGGDIRRFLFRPERVGAGRTSGFTGDEKPMSFSIHRITGVISA